VFTEFVEFLPGNSNLGAAFQHVKYGSNAHNGACRSGEAAALQTGACYNFYRE